MKNLMIIFNICDFLQDEISNVSLNDLNREEFTVRSFLEDGSL